VPTVVVLAIAAASGHFKKIQKAGGAATRPARAPIREF
jgi:hypothetical protein